MQKRLLSAFNAVLNAKNGAHTLAICWMSLSDLNVVCFPACKTKFMLIPVAVDILNTALSVICYTPNAEQAGADSFVYDPLCI